MSQKKINATINISESFVICDFCGQQEKGKGYLQRHIDKKHRKFVCNVCNSIYRQKKNFLDHLRSHFERFVCQYCGLEIIRFEQFQKHVHQKHAKNKQLILSIQSQETYSCRHCIRTFPTAVHRNCHENIVHKGRTEEAFKCGECSLTFITREELRSHSFEHYSGPLYFCAFPDCDRFFKTKKQLRNHNFIHGPAQYECSKCFKRFSQSTNLSKHKKRCKGNLATSIVEMKKEDQEKTVRTAKEQFLLFGGKLKDRMKTIAASNVQVKSRRKERVTVKSEREFVKYPNEHSEEAKQELQKVSVIKIKNVGESRIENQKSAFSAVPMNVIKTRARSSRIFVCDVCALQTTSESSLSSHLKTHRLEKSRETKRKIKSALISKDSFNICELCGLTTKSKRMLSAHIAQEHVKHRHPEIVKICELFDNEKPFACDLCKASFKSSSILKNHMKIHEAPTECPICHKYLPNMTRHLKWHQRPKSNPFHCNQCGKLCSTKQMVQEHYRRVHEKMPLGKTYTCEICDLNFIRNSDLRRHSFIHYSGKIHNCLVPGCYEMFKTAFKLHEHEKVHSPLKEASFSCSFCEKKYLRKTALSKHQKQAHQDLMMKFTIITS